MTLSDFLAVLGGIGLFLYGMSLMGSSIEKLAGPGLEKALERMTSNRFKGLLLGIGVTGVIQSSSATTIMVVGFINAGIMKLGQGVTIMMGANIGTTVTGQILRLADVSSGSFMSILSPVNFAPVCVAVGAMVRLLSRKDKTKMLASIAVGLGTLFMGMSMIESGIAPLKTTNTLGDFFAWFNNPLLGLLLGIAVVSVLQSASASVGVLQAISATGCLSFSVAAPIILGMNVGKFVPVILASAGTGKKARRAIVTDILICVVGSVVFIAVMYGYQAIAGFTFWHDTVNRSGIANFNTLFNLGTTLLLFPFESKLVALSGRIIKEDEEGRAEMELKLLDERFLPTPTLALQQARKVVCAMAEMAGESFALAADYLMDSKKPNKSKLEENERFLDKGEGAMGEYIIRINARQLTDDMTHTSHEAALAVCDFERIGDYCSHLWETADYMHGHGLSFSEAGKREIDVLLTATRALLTETENAYRLSDASLAIRTQALAETIDGMQETLRQRHTQRLEKGDCGVSQGISLMDVLGCAEHIGDHCTNVAMHVLQRLSDDPNYDVHAEKSRLREGVMPVYRAAIKEFQEAYVQKIG